LTDECSVGILQKNENTHILAEAIFFDSIPLLFFFGKRAYIFTD